MKNAQKIRFRASQMHHIMGGTIGLTEAQQSELTRLVKRAWNARTGADKPLTDKMHEKMLQLFDRKRNPELPKMMLKKVKEIYLRERYKRNFPFTNKYVQKGIQQEEEAITEYQKFLKKAHGKNVLFTKNTERLFNDWVQGEPDLGPHGVSINKWNEGWDVKCSWSLDSFPLPGDELPFEYECQNQTYMWLTGAEKWHTVHALVNATEHQLFLEKQKWFYAMNSPSEPDDPHYDEMIQKQREVEKMMIYDYDRFIDKHPYHNMEISRDEWHGEGLDIPLEERIVVRTSYASEEFRQMAKERIKIVRNEIEKLLEN